MNYLRLSTVALVALAALLALFAQGRPAYAATITVNTTADEFGTGAGCSLREAIQAANTDAPFGGCATGSGPDTIVFDLSGTFTLTIPGINEDSNATGDLDIANDLTITGNGVAATIIDGDALDRVFDIDPKFVFGVTVEISGLTIRNGSTAFGGGILTGIATLTLTNVTVSGNTAGVSGGGIYNLGMLTLNSSTVSNNIAAAAGGRGGGIYSSGTLTLTSSAVNGTNTAPFGGGIYNAGTLELTNGSTVSGNTASVDGGGIWNNGTAIVNNSTVSGNEAVEDGGGIVFS